jgi:hypothetical protein
MTLETCMEIGKSCGLTKIEECYDNIYLHSSMIFKYQNINKEIEELQRDIFYHEPDLFCQIFDSIKEDLIKNGWKIKE